MATTTKSNETRGTNLINEIRSLRNEGGEEEAKRLLRLNYIEINAKDIEFYEGEGESRYYIKVKGEALDWSDDSVNRLLAETIENHIDSNDENAQTAKLQSLLERSGHRHGYHNSLDYEPLAEAMDTAFGVGAWCVCDKFTELIDKATDLLYSKLDDLDTFEPLYLMNNYTEPINYYGEPEEAWGLYASPSGYKLVRKGLCYLTIPYGTKFNPENPLACEWAWEAETTLMDCGLWQNHVNHVLHEVATRLTHNELTID